MNKFLRQLRRLRLTKRQLFVIFVLLLSGGLITTQLVSLEQRLEAVAALSLAALVFTLVALREDLEGIEYLIFPILPVAFTIAVCFFYFLLPVRWLTRLPTVIIYGLIMYAILLTENIYNVASIRSIQLLRAAHSVGFLITIITAFLLFDTLFSFHLSSYANAILVLLISFTLSLQLLWSMKLEVKLTKEVASGSVVICLFLGEVAFLLSFWPINTTIFSIFLTTLFYSLAGLIRDKLIDRLFAKTIREFIGVSVITFVLALITTKWG